jgi:hypothetical protein
MKMNADPDRVREIIAQQRAVEARRPPKLEAEPRLGDVVAFVLSVTVLVYALIDTAIGVFL